MVDAYRSGGKAKEPYGNMTIVHDGAQVWCLLLVSCLSLGLATIVHDGAQVWCFDTIYCEYKAMPPFVSLAPTAVETCYVYLSIYR